MGAGIASLVPAVASERIDRMVLIEGVGPLSRPAAKAPAALAEALAEEHKHGAAPVRVFASFEAAVSARLMRSDLDRGTAAVLVERGTEKVRGGVRFTHDPRLALPSRLRFTENQVRAFLIAIPCPVLGLRARPGLPLPQEIIDRRLAAIPHLEQHQVAGGHHAHLTHPEGVAELVAEFLTATRGR
jgi:pimeloyl-ACP methyl ester carboxylesterase